MYLSQLKIENFRQFGEGDKALTLPLNAGLNVLVGENNAGKTTIIDAIRFALGTTDQSLFELERKDFSLNSQNKNIKVECSFKNAARFNTKVLKSAEQTDNLLIIFTKNDLRFWREVKSKDGKEFPSIFGTFEAKYPPELQSTYLRPLRDTESEFSARQQSRLSEILRNHTEEFVQIAEKYHQQCKELSEELKFALLPDESNKQESQIELGKFSVRMAKWLESSSFESTALTLNMRQLLKLEKWNSDQAQERINNLLNAMEGLGLKQLAEELMPELLPEIEKQETNKEKVRLSTFQLLKSINSKPTTKETLIKHLHEPTRNSSLLQMMNDYGMGWVLNRKGSESVKNWLEEKFKPALDDVCFNESFDKWLDTRLKEQLKMAFQQTVETIAQENNEELRKGNVLKILGGINTTLNDISLPRSDLLETRLSFNIETMYRDVEKGSGWQEPWKVFFSDFFKVDSANGLIKSGSVEEKETTGKLEHFLEALTLQVQDNIGLGYNNLVYIATELLLLEQKTEGIKLLLIEEPEAHLHPQLQLKLMKYLDKLATDKGIQIVVTTHSPNLASAAKLKNMTMIQNGQAFSLAQEQTRLGGNDYRFLERFLDVSKANLFFARGVLIVEGIAEEILLPTLAKLIGRDLTDYGVSIVNVGGTGLGRYARIFQRAEGDNRQINIPVACVTDMDVMPNCAPDILELQRDAKNRKWRTKSDFNDDKQELEEKRAAIEIKLAGKVCERQSVQVFVADEWTLEYDLAYFALTSGHTCLAKEIYLAAKRATIDEDIALQPTDDTLKKKPGPSKETQEQKIKKHKTAWKELLKYETKLPSNDFNERVATGVIKLFRNGNASKAIAAQHLAQRLEKLDHYLEKKCREDSTQLADFWRSVLPPYLVDAIEYVTEPLPTRR